MMMLMMMMMFDELEGQMLKIMTFLDISMWKQYKIKRILYMKECLKNTFHVNDFFTCSHRNEINDRKSRYLIGFNLLRLKGEIHGEK